ncbi:MAG: Rrf2 family transcriptional regulator [Chloroflexi bacterium]|nr:Rrf2 family transcriptional regulator [Chloroflexota bacterium]
MQLTRRAEYSIRTAVYLATQPFGKLVLSKEVAKRQDIPANFMVHVVGDLVRAGIVRATRGIGGGLTLARPAGEITIRQIVEASEGPIALNKCLLGHEACERRSGCAVANVWERAQAGMVEVLEATTLEGLARTAAGGTRQRRSTG